MQWHKTYHTQPLTEKKHDQCWQLILLVLTAVRLKGELFISSWGDWEKHQGEDNLWVDSWHVPRISWIWTDFGELLFLLHEYFSSPSRLPFTTAASRTTTKHSGLNLIETEVEIGCVCVSHAILFFPNLPWLPVAFRIGLHHLAWPAKPSAT